MLVTVAPVGRAAFIAPLVGPPEFSSVLRGGYSEAKIPTPVLKGAKADRLLYADVTVWGRFGPCWGGVVYEVASDGTLTCVSRMTQQSWRPKYAHDYGTSPTNDPTISTVIEDALTDSPAEMWNGSTAFMQTNTYKIGQVEWDAGLSSERINEALKFTDWRFGFYHENVAGAWDIYSHFEPAATTASYIVTLSAADAADLSTQSLEGVSERVFTIWGPGSSVEVTTDSDTSHYLVEIGREKWQIINSPNTNSSTDAASLANAAKITKTKHGNYRTGGRIYKSYGKGKHKVGAYEHAQRHAKANEKALRRRLHRQHEPGVESRARALLRSQGTEGGAQGSRIQTLAGIPAYAPSIRPGELAIVHGLPDGPETLRIEEVRCVGESRCELSFGADAGRIEALLARVG